MRPWERNARNLARSLAFYGPVERRAGVDVITSRVAYSVFNIALLSAPVSEQEGELDRRIQLAAAHYAGLNRQWSFWVCEDYLGRRQIRSLHRTFERHGLRAIADSPGLESAGLRAPTRKLPAVEVRPVGDAETRAAFTRLVSTCFHIPAQIAPLVYEPEEAWRAELRAYVAYERGLAVACAALLEEPDLVGIYSVATLPEYRCRGYAEAVMRGALEQRGGAAGRPLVLQSSPSGLELYRRLGFVRTTRYVIFSTT